ncbi:MAG: DUF692 domain-containing protein [Wenzhouxiangella sp.]|nr:MAG: DUF692 domain-containing protein [Wenzhouxiangella sp.]
MDRCKQVFPVTGAGLGLRRALLGPLQSAGYPDLDFLEVAPENWIGVGGKLGRQFRDFAERYPILCHGLSLSLGSPDPLDTGFLKQLREFLDRHEIRGYSDHLSYCSAQGHLYDLMPIPFTEEAVDWVANRISQVQEALGRRIAVENISYYAAPEPEMSELEFINAVVEQADCLLLLDVNNIHVNSVNHRYDALEFLAGLPTERVAWIHVAGHHHEAEDLIVDTHGAAVTDPVWALLDAAYARLGPVPTLLERDFNFPPLEELIAETRTIRNLQARHEPEGLRPESAYTA